MCRAHVNWHFRFSLHKASRYPPTGENERVRPLIVDDR